MSEDVNNDVANYQPAQTVNSNADIQAQIERAVQAALAGLNVQPGAAPAPQQTPEEAARAALNNAGTGLGIDERLNELYALVAHVASKVGL